MTFKVFYTIEARADIKRLYAFLLEQDYETAERAIDRIVMAVGSLRDFPFATRKVSGDDALLRELLIPFGSSGYVALIKIENAETVSILAIRHQREDDYH